MQQLTKHWQTPQPPHSSPSTLHHRLHQRRAFLQNYKAQASRHLAQYACVANHIYNATGKRDTIDSLLQGPSQATWLKAASNEFVRLTRGNKHDVSYPDTVESYTVTKSQKVEA